MGLEMRLGMSLGMIKAKHVNKTDSGREKLKTS